MSAYRGNLIDDFKNNISLIRNFNTNTPSTVFNLDSITVKTRSSDTGDISGLRFNFNITPDSYMEEADFTFIPFTSNNRYDGTVTPGTYFFIDPYFKIDESSLNYYNIIINYEIIIYNGIGNIHPGRLFSGHTFLTSFPLTVKDTYTFSSNYAFLYDYQNSNGAEVAQNFDFTLNGFCLFVNRNGKV